MAHGCTYCTDDFHCEKFTDEKHTSWCYGENYHCKDRRISNGDHIRAMTDEELADKFEEIQLNTVRAYGNDDLLLKGELKGYWLDWLRQEAKYENQT